MGFRRVGRVLMPAEETLCSWPKNSYELWLELHEAELGPEDVYSRFDVPYAAVSPNLRRRIHFTPHQINVFDINEKLFGTYRRSPERMAIYNKIQRGEAILLNRPAMRTLGYNRLRQEYPFWVRN